MMMMGRMPQNMQAQSMLGDAELMAAGRQGDAMNFEHEDPSSSGLGMPDQQQHHHQRSHSQMRNHQQPATMKLQQMAKVQPIQQLLMMSNDSSSTDSNNLADILNIP